MEITKITITPLTVLLNPGQIQQMTAVNQDGVNIPPNILTWHTSNWNAVSITNGLIMGLTGGTANVYATYDTGDSDSTNILLAIGSIGILYLLKKHKDKKESEIEDIYQPKVYQPSEQIVTKPEPYKYYYNKQYNRYYYYDNYYNVHYY